MASLERTASYAPPSCLQHVHIRVSLYLQHAYNIPCIIVHSSVKIDLVINISFMSPFCFCLHLSILYPYCLYRILLVSTLSPSWLHDPSCLHLVSIMSPLPPSYPSCLHLVSSLSLSCLHLVSILSPSYFHLISILSLSCLHLISILSPSCLQLVSILSPSCLHLVSLVSPSYLVSILSPFCLHLVSILSPSCLHRILYLLIFSSARLFVRYIYYCDTRA